MNKTNKTNAMRLMDAAKISYRAVEYEYDESDLGGEHVLEHAKKIGLGGSTYQLVEVRA